jgi:purine-binding chemotaxis protein CheW
MSAGGHRSGKEQRSAIDWHEVYQRLDATRAGIERAWAPDPEETKRILKARASALAREPGEVHGDDGGLEAVEFRLSYEQYAIESRYVREVYALESFTPLPCTPRFVLGIANLRGEILSVIDLKRFFDLPEKGLTDLNKLVVLRWGDMLLGILADAIVGVRRVPLADLQPSLPTLTGIREKYLKGVTPQRTVILEAEKLLMDESIVVQEQVAW